MKSNWTKKEIKGLDDEMLVETLIATAQYLNEYGGKTALRELRWAEEEIKSRLDK